MFAAILIPAAYVGLLYALNKVFGVKYTEVIKNTTNIKRGLVYPVGIGTLTLLLIAAFRGPISELFTPANTSNNTFLWIIPALYLFGIIARLPRSAWQEFDRTGIVFLIFGTFLVGFSEELLVRGIVVSSLFANGFSIIATGLISSAIFGCLHFINYFTGQDLKTTTIQVVSTFLSGLNFYIMLIISGTLWLPIIMHFLFDLSLLLQGGEINKHPKKQSNLDTILVIALYLLPLVGLFFL